MMNLSERLDEIRRRSEQLKKARLRSRKLWLFTVTPAVACMVLCAAVLLPNMQTSQETGAAAAPGRGSEESCMEDPKGGAMGTDGYTPTEQPVYGIHNHQAALAGAPVRLPASGGNENVEITLYQGDECYTIEGEDAALLEQILYNLAYNPDKTCRCMTPYRAETEKGRFGIHWEYDFVRCEAGQADLTVEQSKAIRQIFDRTIGKEGS